MTSATKISEKSGEKFLRKLRFSDFMFRHLGTKNGNCLKAARIFNFELRRNHKMSNDVKLNVLQNGYFGFSISWILTFKIQNFDFSTKITYKMQNFQVNQKTDICDGDAYKQCAQKNQINIFVFSCAMAKKNR